MHIKVGIPIDDDLPNYSTCAVFGLNENQKCHYPGYESEILGYILKRLNISYETVPIDHDFGGYENGSWTGALGKVYNQDVDTVVYSAIYTRLRNSHFDITYPVGFGGYAFVYKKIDDSLETNMENVIRPFESTVWVGFAALYLILLVTWSLVGLLQSRVQLSTWNFYQTLFNQTEGITAPKKIMFITCSVTTIVFSTLYQDVLLINLLKSRETILLSSLSDLADLLKNNRVKIVTDNDKWAFFETIQYETMREDFVHIRNAFQKEHVLLVDNISQVIHYLKKGLWVYPAQIEEGIKIVGTHCELSYIEVKVTDEWLGYVFAKNSSLTPLFNEVITSSYETIEYFITKYILQLEKLSNCTGGKSQEKKLVSISLINMSGLIILIAVGLSSALLVFVIEVMKKYETLIEIINIRNVQHSKVRPLIQTSSKHSSCCYLTKLQRKRKYSL